MNVGTSTLESQIKKFSCSQNLLLELEGSDFCYNILAS